MPDSSYLMLLYFVNKKEAAQKNRNVYKSIRKDLKSKQVTFEEKLLVLCK